MSSYPRRLYGIAGHPVVQSLSPELHNWGFSLLGLPAVYMAWEKNAMELPDFITAVRNLPISGVSVTIPNKEAVMPLVDALTPAAEKVGAVNTLYWEGSSLVGTNTDVDGFLFPLEGNTPPAALVLGAGGAARAVLAGLAELGTTHITVTARSLSSAERLQHDFGCAIVPWEQRAKALQAMGEGLVVNTTPLGMHGDLKAESPLPVDAWTDALRPGGYYTAYDIVYNPMETVFLRHAKASGWTTINGLPFFVAQGLSQFRLWTGQGFPFPEALCVIEAALKKQYGTP